MAITRRLPKSDETRKTVLDIAKLKKDNTAPGDIVLSSNTQTRLDAIQPLFKEKMQDRDDALSAQTVSTAIKDSAMGRARIYISDFIQVFNSGIVRGIFPKEHRPYYHLDVNSNSVPPLTTEASVIEWGEWVIEGDPRRITAGGAAMAMPTIAEVTVEYNNFKNANIAQSTAKDAYDAAQEVVSGMRPDVDSLILRIYNEVETAFDNEPIESKRRNSREWGVVYVSTLQATITGIVTNSANGAPLQDVNVALIESGNIVQTLADGTYTLLTTFTGAGTLEFSLTGYVTQTFPIDVPEGGTLTQDVSLAAV